MSDKKNPLKLHHFGEALVSEMITNMGIGSFCDFLSKEGFCPGKDTKLRDKKVLLLRNFLRTTTKVESMKPMKLENDWLTDTEHDIDVAILNEDGTCFPIELKLGKSGVIESWAQLQSYMRKSPMRKRTTKKFTFVDGAMVSFLSGLKSKQFLDERIIHSPRFTQWGLCIRLCNRGNYDKKSTGTAIDNLPLVFTFEELVIFFNSKKGVDAHKKLIIKILNESRSKLIKEIGEELPKPPRDS